MPKSTETRNKAVRNEILFRELIAAAIKQQGFSSILKSLNKGHLPSGSMLTIYDGVAERQPSGLYDAAIDTDEGPLVLQNAQRTDRQSADPQVTPSGRSAPPAVAGCLGKLTADQLVHDLAEAIDNAPCSLLCTIELTRFDPVQRHTLLPMLWRYIINHRNSNDVDQLVATAAAIRKYVAIMPMDRMDGLAILLEPGHRVPMAIDLEIEVAKMVYRNFEVHPPTPPDPHPELAERLWEMAQAYINPRVLPRDKYPAATSLAIAAIVAMRSPLAERAWQAAHACAYGWFAELVDDDLRELHDQWAGKSPDAAAWLNDLRTSIGVRV